MYESWRTSTYIGTYMIESYHKDSWRRFQHNLLYFEENITIILFLSHLYFGILEIFINIFKYVHEKEIHVSFLNYLDGSYSSTIDQNTHMSHFNSS